MLGDGITSGTRTISDVITNHYNDWQGLSSGSSSLPVDSALQLSDDSCVPARQSLRAMQCSHDSRLHSVSDTACSAVLADAVSARTDVAPANLL